ncbi:MAG: hypothetical protein B7Z55_07470 [Planctomycetales bacterium 12-60-4]|nr:MAG: hypothetical protein B7Z55_07470 [Planctomycetales bacterium 12-60-4]
MAAVTIIAALWLGVWPALADWSPFRAQIERNRALGIDPSAKFYTEQEATSDAYTGISAIQRQNPSVWWVPEATPSSRRQR